MRIRDYVSLLTSNATGQPYDRVIRELSRNKWMDPKQAIEYGMIDKVGRGRGRGRNDGGRLKLCEQLAPRPVVPQPHPLCTYMRCDIRAGGCRCFNCVNTQI